MYLSFFVWRFLLKLNITLSESPSRSLSESFSADNLIQPLFAGIPFACVQQHIQQQVISPQRAFIRRSVGGSSTLFAGITFTHNGTLFDPCCSQLLFCIIHTISNSVCCCFCSFVCPCHSIRWFIFIFGQKYMNFLFLFRSNKNSKLK